MKVAKRNGTLESVSFDKITKRLTFLCSMEPELVEIDPVAITQKVCSQIYDGVSTSTLDELAAQLCISMVTENSEYGVLASRIIISNNQKNTSPSFSETVSILYNATDEYGKSIHLISEEVYDIVMKNKKKLNDVIKYERDFNFDYFGFKTLEKAYLLRINKVIIERIQHLLMRVAIGLHKSNIARAIETYDYMSQKYFIHATPTLFHAGTAHPAMLSCFLLGIEDSVVGIYKCLSDCAQISKFAGGIGIHISNIRSKGSVIHSTNGRTDGIVPMLRVFNETARYINQSGKRLGSFAIYLEPWHADIEGFLDLKKNHGDENARARDLFYSMYIPDLFMKRIAADADWHLFCPSDTPKLTTTFGAEWEKWYDIYAKEGKARHVLPARKLWVKIINSQIETGTPYLVYKDAVNYKSNQQNLGIIKSSNLCTEILEYSDSKEYACCTLGSIGLPRFVEPKPREDLSKEDIVVYSLTDCKFCDKVKTLLSIHGYEYTEHLTDRKAREVKCDDDDGCEAVYEKRIVLDQLAEKYGLPRMTKFPQVFIRDRHIGGFREVRDYFNPTVNFKKLADVTAVMTRNLNNVIDLNFYPVPETELSNKRHRPLGIGIQGLADLYMLMRYPFDSEEAAELNKKVFATIYYAAMRESVELAKREGAYSTFKGSPLSEGKFQFDLWEAEPERVAGDLELDWEGLRAEVMEHGVRNSLLLAPMPTASTSQILGNNECIEPYTSNIYARRTLSGDFVVVNKHMLNDLKALGLWSSELKDFIILNKGSIQNIKTIPDFVKELYKTSWDLSQKALIDQAADRGIYVCQSQSLNLFQEDTNVGKLSSMHFYAWKKGLKTGLYYLRSRPATSAQQFTIDPKLTEKFLAEKRAEAEASKECESCSA